MMRIITTIVLLIVTPACLFAQADSGKLLAQAKAEMKKIRSGEQPDYVAAGKMLEDVVKKDPNNAEAWYYYGCALDRYNHKDGEAIAKSQESLTENTGLAFENCLHLCNDKYNGDILLLDPHTKLLAAWGAQALYYDLNNNRDSVEYCLKQAAQRGGINRTVATYFRQVLDECGRGGYLFTTGDMYTYYLLYLQKIERYRPDVTCIDLNLLNTQWYPEWLRSKNSVTFNYAGDELGKVKNIRWDATKATIPNRNPAYGDTSIYWMLKPSQNDLLLRSDQLLLDILQNIAFTKPVYFSGDVPSNMKLFLDDYLQCKGLTYRLLPVKDATSDIELVSRLQRLPVLSSEPPGYLNNRDNIQVLNNYRFAYTTAAINASRSGHPEEALEFIETAEKKYPEELLPFFADATKKWFENLKAKAANNEKL
ncbi:MAG TPA: hypothetical protein VG738_23185 [Chitinophagaceae bacterium]|nr:hypothetical protein [Chitinophagaceae bacterium]